MGSASSEISEKIYSNLAEIQPTDWTGAILLTVPQTYIGAEKK